MTITEILVVPKLWWIDIVLLLNVFCMCGSRGVEAQHA